MSEGLTVEVKRRMKPPETYNFTQEVKDTWLTALRSGEYEQGRLALRLVAFDYDQPRPITKFCCLGVLEEVAGDACNFFDSTTQQALAILNDSKGFTFTQIADVIEVLIPAQQTGGVETP